ncbi:MAG: glycoside hydrolase family 88 protein, partial [bacterium]
MPINLSVCLGAVAPGGRTSRERYRVAAQRLVEWLLESHPRSSTGTLPYRPEEPNVLLVDTLGMICPLLTRYGERYEKPEAVALAKKQLREFLDHAVDARSGLPFH